MLYSFVYIFGQKAEIEAGEKHRKAATDDRSQ
jgi:hypothetical protein